jgi:hypothetical protein
MNSKEEEKENVAGELIRENEVKVPLTQARKFACKFTGSASEVNGNFSAIPRGHSTFVYP